MSTPYPVRVAADEVAALPGVIALGVPVRLDELAPGDGKGPGEYKRVIVVALYDGTPRIGVPVRSTKLIVRCYGTTRGDAWQVWCAVEPAFTNRRARLSSDRLGVWHSTVVSVTPDLDPDTKQPVVYAIVDYPTTPYAI
jgi:hypothetical protein